MVTWPGRTWKQLVQGWLFKLVKKLVPGIYNRYCWGQRDPNRLRTWTRQEGKDLWEWDSVGLFTVTIVLFCYLCTSLFFLLLTAPPEHADTLKALTAGSPVAAVSSRLRNLCLNQKPKLSKRYKINQVCKPGTYIRRDELFCLSNINICLVLIFLVAYYALRLMAEL